MMPAWLRRRFEAENPDGITRKARIGSCRSCAGAVVRGLDADLLAIPVVCDAIAVD